MHGNIIGFRQILNQSTNGQSIRMRKLLEHVILQIHVLSRFERHHVLFIDVVVWNVGLSKYHCTMAFIIHKQRAKQIPLKPEVHSLLPGQHLCLGPIVTS